MNIEIIARILFDNDDLAQANGDIFYLGDWEDKAKKAIDAHYKILIDRAESVGTYREILRATQG